MSSVNIAGSRLLAPYTVVVDFTTRCRRPGAFWHAARSCIVPMTLSSFIVPRPPARAGGRDHAHVDDGVDVLLGDDLGDHRVADVGAHEGDVADVAARRHDVDADHPVDAGVAGDGTREPATEVARDPGDQDDSVAPAHARSGYLPSLRRWTRVFFSSLRCFFLAMRLRRFLMTEPT